MVERELAAKENAVITDIDIQELKRYEEIKDNFEEMKEEKTEEVKAEEIKTEEVKTEEVEEVKTEEVREKKRCKVYTSVVNETERNIKIRIASTLKQITNIYSNMRLYSYSKKFEVEAKKLYLEASDQNQIEYMSFLNILGDINLKIGTTESLQAALECYQESSTISNELMGDNSIDYLFSLCDIGDVFLE